MSRRDVDIAGPLAVGQRVKAWWLVVVDADAHVRREAEGAITRLVVCDTGILMYVRDDAGVTHGMHLQPNTLNDGAVLRSADYSVEIIKTVPRQSEMPMLAQQEAR
jgi:hypothetical protein